MPNWIELPVNPPNARKIQIHNLSAGTTYEFQVSTVQYSTVQYRTVQYSENMKCQLAIVSTLDALDMRVFVVRLE